MWRGASAEETVIQIQVASATPGRAYPWVLSTGQCGVTGPELLRLGDRGLLKVNEDGTAVVTWTAAMPYPTSGDYALEVLASEGNPNTVVACGDLIPPTTQRAG